VALGRGGPAPDETLIAALRKAHAMLHLDRDGRPLIASAPVSPYEGRILRLAFLDPALQDDVFAGRQPTHITLERLMKSEFPLSWMRQREGLDWRWRESVIARNKPDMPTSEPVMGD
jgi:hypothetical protein